MLQGVQCHTGSVKWQLSCLWHGEKEGDMKLVVGSSSHGSVKLQVPSNHFNLMRERQSRVSGHCFPTWATGAGPIPRTVKEPASTWKVDNSRSFFVVVKIKSWSSPPPEFYRHPWQLQWPGRPLWQDQQGAEAPPRPLHGHKPKDNGRHGYMCVSVHKIPSSDPVFPSC